VFKQNQQCSDLSIQLNHIAEKEMQDKHNSPYKIDPLDDNSDADAFAALGALLILAAAIIFFLTH